MATRRKLSAVLMLLCLAAAGCRGMGCGSCCNSCGGFGTAGFCTKSPHAGKKWQCGCQDGCGDGCGSNCGCGAGCDCSTVCACGEACGCSAARCNGHDDRGCSRCGWLDRLCGCTGCGDCYFSEWWCDPPACQDPCDCYGNYTGPGSVGYYRAPYRRDAAYSETPSNIPPLELIESEPLDEVEAQPLTDAEGENVAPEAPEAPGDAVAP